MKLGSRVLKIYVASAYAHAETADAFGGKLVRALRELGVEATIVSRWHGEALQAGTNEDPDDLELQRRQLEKNYEDLAAADRMIVLGVIGQPRATFSEVGAFLPTSYFADSPKVVAWLYHPSLPSSTNLFMSHRGVSPIPVVDAFHVLEPRVVHQVAVAFMDAATKSVFSARRET